MVSMDNCQLNRTETDVDGISTVEFIGREVCGGGHRAESS